MPAANNHDPAKKVRPTVPQLQEAIAKIRYSSDEFDLNDDIIIGLLEYYNIPRGPIVGSTRSLYKNLILKKIRGEQTATSGDNSSSQAQSNVEEELEDEEEDDEDYQVEEEEEEDEDDESESITDDEDEEEEDREELLNELSDDDIKLADTTQTAMSTNMTSAVSKIIMTASIAFFIAIFSLYLYSTTNFIYPANAKRLTKLVLVIFTFGSICYVIHKILSYYKKRRDEESLRVNQIVNDALEIIQSPENPKGLMPILHIRDTLLTPAERKSKKMIELWNKAVKFVEKHESRVKIEMINIDGEDFRAWKWIGLKNTKVN